MEVYFMDMGAIQNLISSVGFPIFVAVWMLYKTSKDSEKMTESIAELKNAITELTTLLNRESGGEKEND